MINDTCCVSVCVCARCEVDVRFFHIALSYLCINVECLSALTAAKTSADFCVFAPLPAGCRTSHPRPSVWATWLGSSTSSSGAWAWPCWWPSLNSATSHATRPREWRWRRSPNPNPNTPITTIPTATATPARQAAPTIAPSLAKAKTKVRGPAPASPT